MPATFAMLKKIPTLWRFLLPVLTILIVAPFVLTRQQTAQQMEAIAQGAREQAASVTRLLEVTDALMGQQVDTSMRMLRDRCAAQGTPSISGMVVVAGRIVPNLVLGYTPQANRNDLVDSVTRLNGGTATLFVKADDEFVRISTNVSKRDGSRAVGTILDPNGKVITAIRAGKGFQGVVDILGEPYISRYEPIRDSAGDIIGISYVGYKVDLEILRSAVEKSRYLQTGFIAVVDQHYTIRFASGHVPISQVRSILKQPPGNWSIVRSDIPNWSFRVIVAYPLREAQAASLANSWIVIGSGALLVALLAAIILWLLRRLILDPIGSDPSTAIEVVQRISAGDLSPDNHQARPGTLMANVLDMRAKLRNMVDTLHHNANRMSLSASVFEHANDGIFITGRDARIVEVNPAFILLSGYSRDEALGRKPQQLGLATKDTDLFDRVQEQGEWHGETWNQRKDGTSYAARLEIFIVRDERQDISHFVGVFSDITAAKQHQLNLEHLAYHDALTQLPNRSLMSDRLQQALARAARTGEMLAICYFDLDGFKPVNDAMGHEAGDRLLVQLASRVRACLRETDTIARLGGDEFALLLCGLKTAEECWYTLDRLLGVINTPFVLDDESVHVSASIGYTLYPQDSSEPDILLRHADQAMYQAKVNGGGHYHLFDAEFDRQARTMRHIRESIEAGLNNGEFVLHYQPKVNLRRGEVVGMEALIRWQHPEDGLRHPCDFLPAIENTDIAIPLGNWVIRQALQQIRIWQHHQLDLVVSVNIAPRHVMQPDFGQTLALLLEEFPDVSPRLLDLEITESAAIEDIASVAKVINKCKLLGVSCSLDDFGVGYSSLTYLRRLPVETIKIDQSFVRGMLHDNDDLALIAGVISLSREFGRQVVAEGMETADHGVQLLKMGCHLAQGYGISRPMPADAVHAWVIAYQPDESWR